MSVRDDRRDTDAGHGTLHRHREGTAGRRRVVDGLEHRDRRLDQLGRHEDDVRAFLRGAFEERGAVLAGAVGGRFVYELRRELDLYCKLVPLRPWRALAAAPPFAAGHLDDVDVVVVRESTGGVYQGASTVYDAGGDRRPSPCGRAGAPAAGGCLRRRADRGALGAEGRARRSRPQRHDAAERSGRRRGVGGARDDALVVQAAADWDAGMRLVNGVRQGLVAACFTASAARRQAFLAGARAGIVKLDASTAGADVEAPFGGWGHSGVGPPEHGAANRERYTRQQATYR